MLFWYSVSGLLSQAMRPFRSIGIAVLLLLTGCAFNSIDSVETESAVAPLSYRILAEYPHDSTAFTQGLVFESGSFYESTGMWGKSDLRKVNIASGEILRQRSLEKSLFGEGLALIGDRLIQLTWKSGRGFVYDKNSFELIEEFSYSGEGWGITYDGTDLIMSDGTAEIRFLDPGTFAERRRITVTANGIPQADLNELEFVSGSIFANVWKTDSILRIDPRTGKVTGILDLTGLYPLAKRNPQADVLNGIAYDAADDIVYVTGKYWDKVFALRLLDS